MPKIIVGLLLSLALFACHHHQTPTTSPSSAQAKPPITAPTQTQPISTNPVASTPQTATTAKSATKVTTTSPQETATAPTTTESTLRATPPATPVTQDPTFDKEDTIDVSNRLLHPYASKPLEKNIPQQAPWAYEQLKYGIYYAFIKAGTAYIHNRGLVQINGRPAYLLQTTAFSATVIDAVFKVRDINQSWLDAEALYSYGYGQSVREGNYKRDEWLTFDYPTQQYHGQIQKKQAPKNIQGPLEIKVLDMLSSLYYVRAQKLEIGQDIILDMVNREKQYPLVVKVLKKETVKTAAGKFNCIVVEPQIRGEGIFVAKGKSLKVWLTDDAYKMPVKMSVEVFIGSVSAELIAYQRQAPTNIL